MSVEEVYKTEVNVLAVVNSRLRPQMRLEAVGGGVYLEAGSSFFGAQWFQARVAH